MIRDTSESREIRTFANYIVATFLYTYMMSTSSGTRRCSGKDPIKPLNKFKLYQTQQTQTSKIIIKIIKKNCLWETNPGYTNQFLAQSKHDCYGSIAHRQTDVQTLWSYVYFDCY
jgi:hypothetical protein